MLVGGGVAKHMPAEWLAEILAWGGTMIVTFFHDYGAATKHERQMTLDELAALIRDATAPTKGALPWLKFAKFGEMRTARNRSLRHNANVQTVTGILVDYDGERMALDEAECSLDANMENPYLRAFKRDPVRDVLADRGRYIAAVLTIARAYIVAGMPDRPSALASFGPWSDKVRGALMWLGQADPVATVAELAIVDPVCERRDEVFAAIAAAFPDLASGFSVKDLVAAAGRDAVLSAALESVAKGGKDDVAAISNKSLGWWLRRNANRISGGYKLERDGGREGHVRWLLKPVDEVGGGF